MRALFPRTPLLGPMLLGATLIAAAGLPAARKLAQNIGDTDDAMRLQNVRDLADGQDWFDLVQHRMAPPTGLDIHWSRLVDAPQAALIAIARPFAGPENAELFMRAIWPPLLFVAALLALLHVAYRHAGEKAAWALAVMAPLCLEIWQQFMPGRIDHHNVQMALTAGMLAAAVNLTAPRNAAIAGALAALSAAVGLESIGVIAWSALIFAALLILRPDHARATRAYGAAFAAVATLAYLIQTPPGWLLRTGCDALQLNGVAGAVLAGTGLALVSLRPGASLRGRCLRVGAVLALAGAAAVAMHPSCVRGPYADIDPRIADIWLPKVAEAKTWFAFAAAKPGPAISAAILPFAALAYAAWTIRRGERAAAFLVNAALLTMTVAIALLQIRGFGLANLAAAPLAAQALARVPFGVRLRPALSGVAAGAAVSLTVFYGAALISPPASASQIASRVCGETRSFADLARQPAGLVLGELNADAHILALTHHRVAAGPYHRLGQGIYDAMTVYSGPIDQAAAALLRTGADYVALCRTGFAAEDAKAGSFGRALLDGGAPAWAEPVSAPDAPFAVYRIEKAALKAAYPF